MIHISLLLGRFPGFGSLAPSGKPSRVSCRVSIHPPRGEEDLRWLRSQLEEKYGTGNS